MERLTFQGANGLGPDAGLDRLAFHRADELEDSADLERLSFRRTAASPDREPMFAPWNA